MSFKERLAGLMFPMLGICALGWFILWSYLGTNGMDVQPESENYFSQLNANEDRVREALNTPGGDPNRKQIDYAMAIWKNDLGDNHDNHPKWKEAEEIFRKLWNERHNDLSMNGKYDPYYLEVVNDLGALYSDMGEFDKSIECYQRSMEHQKLFLKPDDWRIGRDYNNIGFAQYMRAQREADWSAREAQLKVALENLQIAEKLFRQPQDSDVSVDLMANLQNQCVTYTELGEWDKAEKLRDEVEKTIASWRSLQKHPAAFMSNPVTIACKS